ncbi:hypothetical protein [Sinorhizobium meliloti]|uniref:hypothetical protein n=1 Tax=Rhizobium meliloti TaxID=382 RepID=UPI000FD8E600|nr:hypothetical protein [Sinorhizobium meliloti]RVK33832.1 hypothetical protein CN163_23205 [Sinorhizobium meliloti]
MDASWKMVIKGLKSAPLPDREALISTALLEVAGAPVSVREVRKRLLLLSISAINGNLGLISVGDGALVCLISFADLVELLSGPPPTLGEVMDRARGGAAQPPRS